MEAGRILHSFRELPDNGYGLELMVDRGCTGGPIDACSSARPMHAPELCPMHGMPSISGTSGLAAVVVKSGADLGTMKGTQVVVKVSISSPDVHCASGVPGSAVKMAVAGAAAAATMKAPIRNCRRMTNERVVIPQV